MDVRPTWRRPAAVAATACLTFFVLVVITLPVVQRHHYHVVSQTISELALGRLGWLMNAAFVVLGVGTALLAIALRAALPHARWAPRLLVLAAPFDVVSAAFHASLAGRPMPATAVVHVAAGISTWLLTIAAMFCSIRPFRTSAAWERFAGPTRAWAWTSAACMAVLGPNVLGQDHFGLGQRATAASFTSWLLVVAVRAARTADRETEDAVGPTRTRPPARIP